MTRYDKLLRRLLSGTADQTIRFEELCALLGRLGFAERHHGGSHRIFFREGITEILNLQPRPDGTAKPYQVRQVREVIVKYGLAGGSAEEGTDEA
ncbi:MAG: type II toxin-antitoxin system HicA family toxin [Gemmatimonadaceae bacterium]